jgi:hypothetical protein
MTDANTFYQRGIDEGGAYQQGQDATLARVMNERAKARQVALENALARSGSDLVQANTPNDDGSYNYGPASTAPGMPPAATGVAVPPPPTPSGPQATPALGDLTPRQRKIALADMQSSGQDLSTMKVNGQAAFAAPGQAAPPVAGAGRGLVNPPLASPGGPAPTAADAAPAGAGSGVSMTPPPALDPSQLPPAPSSGGMGAGVTPPTRGAALRAMALAHFKYGNEDAGQAHIAAAKSADFEDAYNQGVNDKTFHPADVMTAVNGQPGANTPGHPHLSIGVVNGPSDGVGSTVIKDSHGQDTQYAVTVIDPSGQGYTSVHKENVMRKINGFVNAMKVDPQRALAGLGEVDAHLAALYATKLGQQLEVQKGNTAAVGASEHNESYGVMAEARMQAANAAMDKATAYGLKIEAGKTPKEMDPADVTRLNEIGAQIDEAPDAKSKATLEAAWRRQYGVAAGKIGKVVEPGIGKTPKEQDPAKIQGAVESYIADRNSQDPAFKKLPYNAKRAAALEAVNGGAGGGLPNPYGASTPPPVAAPTPPPAGFNPADGASPTVRGVQVPPPAAPVVNPTAGRIADLRSQIQADDALKAGGLSGMGGRAIRAGRMPMAMAERMQAEQELQRLQGGGN